MTTPTSRRDFLKFVVAGSVSAGCPFPHSLRPIPSQDAGTNAAPQVGGDHFAVCHEVRDGTDFPKPPVSKRYDVIIVGGGASGMSAAHFLKDHNFLLLEKEPHFGGNAFLEEYQGQAFATGSAFDEKGTESYQLATELGLTPLPIDNSDPSILRGVFVEDTWRSGLDHLPYSPIARAAFHKFRLEILAMDPEKDAAHLDSFPISDILKNYPRELTDWWDAYGLSNWGAATHDTSALCVVEDMHYITANEDIRVTLPGGNGSLTRALAKSLEAKHADRMMNEATIVSIDPQPDEVNVTYFHDGETHTVAAKAVIVAAPKMIAARVVSGLSVQQSHAMRELRYCPYPVVNMIFDKPVWNRAYDTWCPGNAFTDVIVADPYKDIADGLKIAFYIGQSNVVGNTTTDMVAYVTGDVFVQIWIGAQDKLPRRIYAVYLNDRARLRHVLELSNWAINPSIPSDAFVADVAGAARIAFARPDEGAEPAMGPPPKTKSKSKHVVTQ